MGLTGLFAQIMPDMKFERKRVWIHGDKVIVISHVTANITGRPKGQKEVPLFPGIPAEKLMNKEFKTIALDIHKIVDGKIKQSYHIEDWHTALEQMLYEKEAPCFGLYPDFTNFHVPKPIKTFYDQILSNPGHIEYGQNMTLINQTFAEDWNIRPNPFSKEQGIEAGPFPKGLKQMTGMWHQMMPHTSHLFKSFGERSSFNTLFFGEGIGSDVPVFGKGLVDQSHVLSILLASRAAQDLVIEGLDGFWEHGSW